MNKLGHSYFQTEEPFTLGGTLMGRGRQRRKKIILVEVAFLWGFLFSPAGMAGEEPNPALVEEGREYVWEEHKCHSCHQINGGGGTLGPSLNGVFKRRSVEFIQLQLETPEQNDPNSDMPTLGLNEEEIRAIMAYLRTLPERSHEQHASSLPIP